MKLIVSILSFALFTSTLIYSIPPNDDEYLFDVPLVCKEYPMAAKNIFRYNCDNSNLYILGEPFKLLSFYYTGAGATILHYPFYKLINNHNSTRFLGLTLLFFTSLFAARLTKTKLWMSLLIVGCSYPLAYQSLFDTGPVAFQCMSIFGLPYLLSVILAEESKKKRIFLSLVLGFWAFFALEQKAIFALALPSTALLFFAFYDRKTTFKNLISAVLPGLLLFAVLTGLLFSGKTQWGSTYFNDIVGLGKITEDKASKETVYEHAIFFIDGYLTNLFHFSHRHFVTDLYPSRYISLAIISLMFISISSCLYFATKPRRERFYLWTLSAGLVFFLIAQTKGSWAGHHIIFVFPFVLSQVLSSLSSLQEKLPRASTIVLSLILLLNASLILIIDKKNFHDDSSWGKLEIYKILDDKDFSKKHIVAHLDWGSYLADSLYGPKDQFVVSIEPLWSENTMKDLIKIAKEADRKIAIMKKVKTDSNFEIVKSHLPTLEKAPTNTRTWELWVEP